MKYHDLEIPEEQISSFCNKHHIRKFALFGSILREDFGPQSDVDVLVEFDPDHVPGLAFIAMQQELAELFGRTVDLVTTSSLRNPFRRQEILATQHVIHAA